MRSRNAAILTWIVTAAWSSRWKTGFPVGENGESRIGKSRWQVVLERYRDRPFYVEWKWSAVKRFRGVGRMLGRQVRSWGSLGVPSNRLLCNDWFERKLQPQLRPIAYAYGLGGFSAIPAPIDFVTAWAVSRSWNLTTTSLTRKHESAVFFHRQRSLPRGRGGRSQYASG